MNSNISPIHRFDFLWEIAVVPAINQCKIEAEMYNKKFVRKAHLKQKDLNNLKKLIEDCYKEAREKLKKIRHIDEEKGCFDICKLASLLVYALVKYKPFMYDDTFLDKEMVDFVISEDDKKRIHSLLINYKVAIYSAFNCIYISLISETNVNNLYNGNVEMNKKLNDILKKRQSIKLYNYGTHTYDSFFESLVKNLAYCDTNDLEYDVITYSTMFEALREYNKIYFFLDEECYGEI